MKKYTVYVKLTEDGEPYIDLPPELVENLGWDENTTLYWHDNADGTFSLREPHD